MKHYVLVAAVLIALVAALGVALADWQEYKQLYQDEQYQELVRMCQANRTEIESDVAGYIILKYCGLAKLKLYDDQAVSTDLNDAIEYLEQSIAYSYSEEAAFHLGQARMRSLDFMEDGRNKADRELAALNEMWESIRTLHAMENFAREVLSDGMLIWSRNYRDLLVERVIKNEENKSRLRLLTANLRMLADRFTQLDPSKGDTEVRRNNLTVFKEWMQELLECTYFDNNIVVGMHKYKADRHMEKYDQTVETEDQFSKALHFYGQALQRAKSSLARAALFSDIAYLCSLYSSEDKEKLVAFYKTGFTHAHQGLMLIRRLAEQESEEEGEEFHFAPDLSELTTKLQKAYGSNLTGLCYFHYLRNDYGSAVSLRNYTFDAGFDWEGKVTTLMYIADSASHLAADNYRRPTAFQTYKKVCLFASSRAFKLVLKKFGGRMPDGSEEFCNVYSNYVNYLRRFGEGIEAQSLTLQYGRLCDGQ